MIENCAVPISNIIGIVVVNVGLEQFIQKGLRFANLVYEAHFLWGILWDKLSGTAPRDKNRRYIYMQIKKDILDYDILYIYININCNN